MAGRGRSKAQAPAGGVRILNQETVLVSVDAVRPHPRNVNEGDRAAIRESLKENGFWGSLIVQRSTGYILAGKHRWEEATAAGYAELPVTYVDVDDATALRIMLADNRTGRLGADDDAALAALLQEIAADAGTLAGTAFDDDSLAVLLKSLEPPPPPPPPEEPGGKDNYVEQYGVVVVCANAADQAATYERLRGEGFNCKVVTT
jgi:ParB-like chromosome segregation protein Spo0J